MGRLQRCVLVFVVAVAVATQAAPTFGLARLPEGPAPAQPGSTQVDPGRAVQGGDVPAEPTTARKFTRGSSTPRVLRHPSRTTLQLASSRVVDLRDLHGTVVKHDRPERNYGSGERDVNGSENADPDQVPSDPDANGSVGSGAGAVAPEPEAIDHSGVDRKVVRRAPAASSSFDGLDFDTWGAGHPPDTNGDVGPTYYIETVNTSIGIYRKSDGNQVAAFTFNAFMSLGGFGNLCDTDNFGDPVVVYDTFEDRWIITDFAFALDGSGNVTPQTVLECIAVSRTGDPVTGGWNYYSVETQGGLGDYPKLGVWRDGLYLSVNMFGYCATCAYLGPRVYAIDKARMYAGAPTVSQLSFDGPTDDFTLIPANARLQAGTPPAGTPEYFTSTEQWLNALSLYKLSVDWANVSAATFSGPFIQKAPNCWPDASVGNAPTPANTVDTLDIRAMAQNQYTNIGGAESLWVTHTVRRGVSATNTTCNAPTTGFATVRWYQANVTGGAIAPNVVQGATFDPDAANSYYRFMPSLAVDREGDMAVGYTRSNSTTNPQIRYAGRLVGDPTNTLGQAEQSLIDGTGSQAGSCGGTCHRWGDYSGMALDPDGCTFWMSAEYYATNGGSWLTRIGAFKYPSCDSVGTGVLQGTVTDGTNPISGATVTLGQRTTTTNGSGAYSFTVPSGTYPILTAAATGFTSQSLVDVAIPNGGTATRNILLSVPKASTTTVVTSNHSSSVFGQPVTFTATVSSGSGTPTGTVQFKVDGTSVGSPVSLVSGVGQSAAISNLTVGNHAITAVYSGSAAHVGSTSSSFSQTVGKASTHAALSIAPNPAVHGQRVTLTATITALAPGGGTPSGKVQFKRGGTTIGGQIVLVAGQAKLVVSTLPVGADSITATYLGDANYTGSTSPARSETVNKASSKTVVVESRASVVKGHSITFTATVSAIAPGAGNRTGSVTFLANGAVIGTKPVNSTTGKAVLTITWTKPAGSYTIVAKYAGDTNFKPSTSAGIHLTVTAP